MGIAARRLNRHIEATRKCVDKTFQACNAAVSRIKSDKGTRPVRTIQGKPVDHHALRSGETAITAGSVRAYRRSECRISGSMPIHAAGHCLNRVTISGEQPPRLSRGPENARSSGRSTACFSTETFGSDSVNRACAASRDARRLKGRAAMAHDLLHELCAVNPVRGGIARASGGKPLQALKLAGTEAGKRETGGQEVIHRTTCIARDATRRHRESTRPAPLFFERR
jgi:hypothetical protein